MTDSMYPELISMTVRHILHAAVEAAIENWNEGYWDEYGDDTPVREVLGNFQGYLDAWLESVSDEDDPGLAKSILEVANEEIEHANDSEPA